MRLKYYLRGIGIGVIFTIVILAVTGQFKKMTDEEIITAAKKLGMVEGKTSGSLLSPDMSNSSITPESTPSPDLEQDDNDELNNDELNNDELNNDEMNNDELDNNELDNNELNNELNNNELVNNNLVNLSTEPPAETLTPSPKPTSIPLPTIEPELESDNAKGKGKDD